MTHRGRKVGAPLHCCLSTLRGRHFSQSSIPVESDFPSLNRRFAVPNATSDTPFRPLGALLGWIFPGLGHIAAGNTKRGLLAMSGVLFLFLTGILVGGIDSVDRKEDSLWFVAQAGCGPIAFVTSYANDSLLKTGEAAPLVEMPAPPGQQRGMFASSFKGLAHANEFGTFFVFLAGLLNVCVLLDAAVREPSSDGASAGRRAGEGAKA